MPYAEFSGGGGKCAICGDFEDLSYAEIDVQYADNCTKCTVLVKNNKCDM